MDDLAQNALHRYREEIGLSDFDAIDAILTDWLEGHRYLKD
ncbi:hypothetical protein [Shinella sp. M31]